MRKTALLMMCLPAFAFGEEAAKEAVEVGRCDGEGTVRVEARPETPAEGAKLAAELMQGWKAKHPARSWDQKGGVLLAQAKAPQSPGSVSPVDQQKGATTVQPVGKAGPSAESGGAEVRKEGGANVQTGHTYGAFGPRDEAIWKAAVEAQVKEGHRVFHDAKALGGTVAISCDMCHPDAANTHPETYPKYQVQLGRVALLRDMINWCIINPVRGKPIADDDARMKAMEAYILSQRKGVALEAGKH